MAKQILSHHKTWLFFAIQTTVAIIFSMSAASEATRSEKRTLYLEDIPSSSQVGRLVLSSSNSVAALNTPGSLSIVADTGGVSINSVGLEIQYRSDVTRVDNVQFNQSICNIIIEDKVDPVAGIISLNCGVPSPGISTQMGQVAVINYTPISKGSASFQIQSGARLLANDGKATNILKFTQDATINVREKLATPVPSTPTPTPISTKNSSTSSVNSGRTTTGGTTKANPVTGPTTPTNDDKKIVDTTQINNPAVSSAVTIQKNKFLNFSDNSNLDELRKVPVTTATSSNSSCFSNFDVEFVWLKQDGVESFEYELNDSMLDFNQVSTTTDNKATVKVKPGSKQFFHVRAIKGDQKSQSGVVTVSTCQENTQETNKTLSVQQSLANSVNQAFKSLGRSVMKLFAK